MNKRPFILLIILMIVGLASVVYTYNPFPVIYFGVPGQWSSLRMVGNVPTFKPYGQDDISVGVETDPIISAVNGVVYSDGTTPAAATATQIATALEGAELTVGVKLAYGTALPNICSTGEQVIDTDTSPYGFFCTATDVWNGTNTSAVARYLFESGALTTDSYGSNDLTNYGADEDTDGILFVEANSDHMEILDTNLSSDFPFHGANADGSFVFKYISKSLPTATEGHQILTKFNDSTGVGSFAFRRKNSDDTMQFLQAYSGGTEESHSILSPTIDKAYICSVAYDSSDNSVTIMAYDTVLEELFDFDTETSGQQNWTHTFANAMTITTEAFNIGSYDNADGYADMIIDDLYIYNEPLTVGEAYAVILRIAENM